MANKRTVYATLDPTTYQALLEAAVRSASTKLTEFTGYLIQRALEMDEDVPPALRRALAIKRRQEERNSVRITLRTEYSRMRRVGDLEGAEEVLGIAVSLGIPEDDITGTALLNDLGDDTEVGRAEQWLKVLMEEHGELPERTIKSLAERDGISKLAVDQAKRRLGIPSQRKGRRWVWVLVRGDGADVSVGVRPNDTENDAEDE